MDKILSPKNFSKSDKIRILAEMKTSGKSWEECAEKILLPEMFIQGDDGLIEFGGRRMSIEDFHKLRPYANTVLIKQRDY